MSETRTGEPQHARSRLGLRTLLIVLVVAAVASAIAPVSFYFISKQQENAERRLGERREAVRADLRARGLETAASVVRSSERALATMDFLFLTEIVENTVEADPDVAYGIIMDKSGRAIVHSDRSLANSMLEGEADSFALAQTKPVANEILDNGATIVEAIAPIEVAGERWGVVRFGLSLERLNREVAAAQGAAREEMRRDVRNSIAAAALLALLGALVGGLFAGRISHPLSRLLDGVRSVRDGNLDKRVEVGGSRELAELGMAYNDMTGRLSSVLSEMADKASIERELSVARAVQQDMIPSEDLHQVGGFSVIGHCEMAENCGGDWWGYQELANGRLLIVIGDATGHGLPAAIIAATARGSLQAAAAVDPEISPRAALEAIHNAIQDAARDHLVMTACAIAIERDGRTVEFANAGHVLPLTCATTDGEVVNIGVLAARGTPLGSPSLVIGEGTRELAPGAVLLLMTDGLRERLSPEGKMYGDRRLHKLLRRRPVKGCDSELTALRDDIVDSVRTFAAGEAADDDLTIVLCRAPRLTVRAQASTESAAPIGA